MADDLPSIASLRAFAEAARTLSFKQAAAALHVSPSALSRQIQGLEEHLGAALFHRRNPGLELTEAGARYLGTVERVLRELREAGEALAPGDGGPLRVSALESFSARWLVPRLPEFHAAHPDVDLDFFPVCSPALRDGEPPLREPDDLARHVWIHVSQVPDAWSDWTRKVGAPELRPRRDLHFDHVAIALSAAESGQGVALSTPILCAAELADGRLCIPLDLPVRSAQTYHLVCRPEGLEDPRIVAFRDWLVAALA